MFGRCRAGAKPVAFMTTFAISAEVIFSKNLGLAVRIQIFPVPMNPAKASDSVAPTMVVCALAGYLTARLFLAEQRQQHRLLLTGLVGLLIGLAANFRLPNLFLSSGYFLFFFISFLLSRKIET